MPFQDGDFLLIEYTIVTKEDNKVVDTTSEEEAKAAGIYSPGEVYEPKLVILGEGTLFRPVEEALKNAEVGQELTVEVPPEQAFGPRDPNKLKIVSLRELQRRNIVPRINEVIEYDGQRAIVRAITGGRVLLDFNHPLAGKTLIFRIKVLKKVEEPREKLVELLHRWLTAVRRENLQVSIEDGTAKITLPPEALTVDTLGLALRRFVRDVRRYLPEIKVVEFVERVQVQQ